MRKYSSWAWGRISIELFIIFVAQSLTLGRRVAPNKILGFHELLDF